LDFLTTSAHTPKSNGRTAAKKASRTESQDLLNLNSGFTRNDSRALTNGNTGPFRLIEILKQHHRHHEIRRGSLGELKARITAFINQD